MNSDTKILWSSDWQISWGKLAFLQSHKVDNVDRSYIYVVQFNFF